MKGFSLRDDFAMAALTGMMANDTMLTQRLPEAEDLALHAYRIADAMLIARDEGGPASEAEYIQDELEKMNDDGTSVENE